MAKFLTGNELNFEVEKLLENAVGKILLISPYIKLHDRYKSLLETKKNKPNIEIIIVFGKNEEDLSKSMKATDFNFLKEFPNIEIRYEKRLHAKYYANEESAILTSMNLYSFSQDNNIEFGVLTKSGLLNDNLDGKAWDYFERVIDQSEILFKKVPVFDSSLLGLNKKYKESVIEEDRLTDFFINSTKSPTQNQTKVFQNDKNQSKVVNGFCIRTGKEIPFNTRKPMTDEAYKNWLKFENTDYPEKYCHFSGEASNGETTFSKPILRKNWKKAAETFKL